MKNLTNLPKPAVAVTDRLETFAELINQTNPLLNTLRVGIDC